MVMRTIGRTLLVASVIAVSSPGCTPMTPEQRAAAEQARAEQERVHAQECAAMGMLYMSGSCVMRGGSPGT
jgi:hypothetical protein